MKLLSRLSCIFLLTALACSPENENLNTNQIETGQVEPTADSVNNTKKDGTATASTNEPPKLVLPQPVLQLLSKKYPGWKEPVLMESAQEEASGKEQGPLVVRANFNDDTLQDIALQIRDQRNMVVVALVQDSASWQLHELKRDILFNERGTYKSLYYIYLTEAGTTLFNNDTRQEFKIPHDAVSVGLDDNTTTFVYQNNEFEAY